jgi:hypothetical protein
LFYVIIAKALTLSIRLAFRRSLGRIVILLAILDEAAAQLEANLIHAPSAITGVGASIEPGQSLTPSQNLFEWWAHIASHARHIQWQKNE